MHSCAVPSGITESSVVQRVAIDTNIFFTDLLLQGSLWRKLNLLQREGFIDLYFPEVVVREMVRHFNRQHHKDLNRVIDALDEIRPFDRALDDLGVKMPAGDKAALRRLRNDILAENAYEPELRGKLREAGIQVLELPHVDTQDMVDAYISSRKPFKTSDAGVADYLIWETVRALVHSDPEDPVVLLLTKNSGDFALDGELHPDLKAILTPPAEVAVCINVEEFLDSHQDHFQEIEAREKFSYSEQSDHLALAAARGYLGGIPCLCVGGCECRSGWG